MSQLITVTFTAADHIDAEKLVEGLAYQGNGLNVLVQPAVYGRPENITFVKAETVVEPATQPVSA